VPRGRDYLHILRSGWLIVLCATLLSAGAACQALAARAPIFTATARLFVVVPGTAGTRSAMEGSRGALSRMETYAALATSPQVTSRAVDSAELNESPGHLAGRVSSAVAPGSALLDVSVTGGDPANAQAAANAVASSLIQVSRELESSDTGPVADLVVVDGAVTAQSIRGSLSRYLLLGGSIGLALSVILVLARGVRRGIVLDRGQIDHVTAETLTKAGRPC
jgi:capsular polysaccharide biosynthesis protein